MLLAKHNMEMIKKSEYGYYTTLTLLLHYINSIVELKIGKQLYVYIPRRGAEPNLGSWDD